MKFDIIVHFELIEHLIDPNSFIKSIYENLNQGGLCIFTTPNALGLDSLAIHYNKTRFMAGGIYPPMHINAFSTQNILLFAYRNNFKLKSVETPGKFDMSLLSIHIDGLDDEILREIAQMDNQIKAHMQYLLSYVNGSTHMRVVLEK